MKGAIYNSLIVFPGASVVLGGVFFPQGGSVIQPSWNIAPSLTTPLSLPSGESSFALGVSLFHDGWIMSILVSISLAVSILFLSFRKIPLFNSNLLSSFALELVWIILPLLILIFIALPSLSLLYQVDSEAETSSESKKTTGFQWYWVYDGSGDGAVESFLSKSKDNVSNLLTDNCLKLKSGFQTRNLITSGDVMHSWAIPSLSIKVDAIPGRLNQVGLGVEEGNQKFFGQCSELCGVNHSFMPISVLFIKEGKEL